MSTSYDLLSCISSTIEYVGECVAGTDPPKPFSFPDERGFYLFGSINPHHFLNLFLINIQMNKPPVNTTRYTDSIKKLLRHLN